MTPDIIGCIEIISVICSLIWFLIFLLGGTWFVGHLTESTTFSHCPVLFSLYSSQDHQKLVIFVYCFSHHPHRIVALLRQFHLCPWLCLQCLATLVLGSYQNTNYMFLIINSPNITIKYLVYTTLRCDLGFANGCWVLATVYMSGILKDNIKLATCEVCVCVFNLGDYKTTKSSCKY